MNIRNAIAASFEASRKAWKPLGVLYGVNIALSIVLALAFKSVLSDTVRVSGALKTLLEGFNYTTYRDFMINHGDLLSPIMVAVLWAALVYLIVNVFLAGGVLGYFRSRGEPYTLQMFFSDCGRFFFRFVRIFLLLAFFSVIILLVSFFILELVWKSAAGDADSESTVFVWSLLVGIVLSMIGGILLLINDYAKVMILHSDERSAWKAAVHAFSLVFRNLFTVGGFGMVVLLAVVLTTVSYWWLESQIGMTSGVTVLIMTIIQQVFICTRIWLRIFLYGGEVHLGRQLAHNKQASVAIEPDPVAAA